jgi:MFS family permease
MSHDRQSIRARVRTPQAAAIAGIIFSVLLGTALLLIRTAVPSDPSDARAWLTEPAKRDSVKLALNLVPFAGIAFLWFIGVIRDRIGQREDRLFATVFLGSGLLFVAMLFVAAAVAGGLIAGAAFAGGQAPSSELWEVERRIVFTLLNVYAVRMGGVFILSTTAIGRRTGFIPRWLVVAGIAAGLILLIGSGFTTWVNLVLPVWALILSVYILLRSEEVERRAEVGSS